YKIEPQDPALQRDNQLSNPSLTDSRDNFMAIDKKLSDVWHSLGQEKQKRLITVQRQWIKNKEAICGKISIKGTDQEVIKMFKCQYDMTKIRISELMTE
ncbi:lysozyme inhibitor LprI family protein, partial [Serratia montpellierensis]